MDNFLIIKSIVMGIVEGVSEFLPISSTGHLILAGNILNFLDKEKRDIYEVFIQLGAMLAVIWEYRKKLAATVLASGRPGVERRLLFGMMIAFLPAATIGLCMGDIIKAHLFAPTPVACALIVGGFVILWAERRQHIIRITEVEQITLADAFKVGLIQCLALIPGTSRSGATIIGGLLMGLSRKAAAEFSFFLGVLTLGAASLYSLFKARHGLSISDTGTFAFGFLAAFVSALFVIRALLSFIKNHSFIAFAWYRIAFGLFILLTAWTGVLDWSV